MSPLATNDLFDLRSAFFTDSVIFNNFKIKESFVLVLEKVFAVILLIVLLPLILISCLLIRATMGNGVFYSQIRVGQDGKLFSIYKFRTMVTDAEVATGPILSQKNDPRVTPLGRFLRTSHIDELPQLLNVLKGEMSFVGPRPERPVFVDQYLKEIPGYGRRHSIRPGITGLAQICLPYDATAKEKLEYDNFYIDNRHSVLFNCIIGGYTGLKMITVFKI